MIVKVSPFLLTDIAKRAGWQVEPDQTGYGPKIYFKGDKRVKICNHCGRNGFICLIIKGEIQLSIYPPKAIEYLNA